MLRYFPASFPDETLYSRLCRYHRLSSHEVDRLSLRELVGLHTHVIVSALPSKLATLVARLPVQANVKADDIVASNTLLSFYAAFMPPHRAALVHAAMLSDSASGIKMSIGLTASRLGGQNYLRFCSVCMQEEYLSTGQPYWHRVHQLPGVLVCPVHKRPLRALTPEALRLNRQKLFLPDDIELAGHLDDIQLPEAQLQTGWRIARISADVLNGRIQATGLEWAHRLHRSNAAEFGLIRSNGRVRVDDLESVVGLYCNSLPANLEFGALRDRLFDWALKLLRKPRGSAMHPLAHIVLMDCLRHVDEKSGEVCARVALDVPITSHSKRIVDQVELLNKLSVQGATLSDVARAMGISVTTAAVEAARAGFEVSRRPKHLTAERVTGIGMSLKSGLAVDEVAAKHDVSVVSVYRILRMDLLLAKEYEEKLFIATRDQYRRRYFDTHADKAAYAWLRRHDRLWLEEQHHIARARRTKNGCVDWGRRDTALACQIVEIEAQLRSLPGKPVFISETKLKNLTSMADTIARNLCKLPETTAALKACAESAHAHQRRRIMWAYSELKSQPQFHHQIWEVLRLAGVRKLHPLNEGVSCLDGWLLLSHD